MGLVDFSISDIGETLVKAREAITGKRVEDPTEMAKIDLQLAQLQEAVNTGQIEINKIEAAHKNLFVSGWRPSLGWICSLALGYTYLIQPMIEWYIRINGLDVESPKIDTGMLYQLVIAMLGLAGLRTYEKKSGVARSK